MSDVNATFGMSARQVDVWRQRTRRRERAMLKRAIGIMLDSFIMETGIGANTWRSKNRARLVRDEAIEDRRREYDKRRRAEHRDRRIAETREWRRRNPHYAAEKARERRERLPDATREYNRTYKAKNRDALNEKARARYRRKQWPMRLFG